VRRPGGHLLAFPDLGVPGANRGADRRKRNAFLSGKLINLAERRFEVFADVVAERLQRRDVNSDRLVRQYARSRLAHESIETMQESGESFARAGGSRDQHIAARADLGPAKHLRFGGASEARLKPLRDQGIEAR
jgi:hypothetical protein